PEGAIVVRLLFQGKAVWLVGRFKLNVRCSSPEPQPFVWSAFSLICHKAGQGRSTSLKSRDPRRGKPTQGSSLSPDIPGNAQVGQLVEHMTENHGVGGSIPPLGTIPFE